MLVKLISWFFALVIGACALWFLASVGSVAYIMTQSTNYISVTTGYVMLSVITFLLFYLLYLFVKRRRQKAEIKRATRENLSRALYPND